MYEIPYSQDGSQRSLTAESKESNARIKNATPKIKTMCNENLIFLGALILQESLDRVLLEKLEDLKRMSERLSPIDVHDALVLLKNCFSITKLTYFIKCASTFKARETLQKYDETMKKCLESVLNVELDMDAWNQSSLQVKNGGLGIRIATDRASGNGRGPHKWLHFH